ncbi:MAG: hypothetical protein ACJ8GW_11495 [Massilia sp.]
MDSLAQKKCLHEIERLWRLEPSDKRPEMVWIGEHEAVAPDSDTAHSDVRHAWLMDDYGVHRREAHDFVRFLAIHGDKPWATGMTKPRSTGVFHTRNGDGHIIGMASFAPIMGSELVYLEYIWGGRNGRGSRVRVVPQKQGLEYVENVWIS